jgi:hypothetical protein
MTEQRPNLYKVRQIGTNSLVRDHLHCSEMCEHPQPFCVGEMILCGRCFYFRDRVTPMIECSTDYCA